MEENAAAAVLTEEQKHLLAVSKVNKLYILTLVFCAAAILGALVWAVLDSILMGLVLAVCAIIVYVALTTNILYRFLGISYKSDNGRATVTQLYGKGREEIWIPERIILLEVKEIGDRAFAHKSSASIRAVHLPGGLEVIGKDVFALCDSLTTVYFGCRREELEKIKCDTELSSYELIFIDDVVTDAPEVSSDAVTEKADKEEEK